MDLSDVVSDSDLAETYTIQRITGSFQAGGWVANSPVSIPAYGVVSVATQEDLDAVPEGDKITGGMVFHSTQQMFVTKSSTNQTSDQLLWQGDLWRVYSVGNYSNRQYWRALAARMAGN